MAEDVVVLTEADGLAAQDAVLGAQAPADQAPSKQKASAKKAYVALPGNCAGELEALPQVEGVTHTAYKCKVCGQVVYVGHEDREVNGLPPEHAKLLEEGK